MNTDREDRVSHGEALAPPRYGKRRCCLGVIWFSYGLPGHQVEEGLHAGLGEHRDTLQSSNTVSHIQVVPATGWILFGQKQML